MKQDHLCTDQAAHVVISLPDVGWLLVSLLAVDRILHSWGTTVHSPVCFQCTVQACIKHVGQYICSTCFSSALLFQMDSTLPPVQKLVVPAAASLSGNRSVSFRPTLTLEGLNRYLDRSLVSIH